MPETAPLLGLLLGVFILLNLWRDWCSAWQIASALDRLHGSPRWSRLLRAGRLLPAILREHRETVERFERGLK